MYLDAGLAAVPDGLVLSSETLADTLDADLVPDVGRLVMDAPDFEDDALRVVPMRVPPVLLPLPRIALVPDAIPLFPVAALRPCHLSRPCSGLSFPG